MCEFCLLFDFSSVRARVDNGIARLEKAPTNIPFLSKQQFNFCPVCGRPRDASELKPTSGFPKNLRRIRKLRGVTQEALGRELGMQKSAISKYEKGRTQPNAQQIVTICRLLGVTPQELL